MNIKEHERIDNAMKYGKRISSEVKKNLIPIKSLPNAELRISNDNGWTISGHIKYNHHRINITYYRFLPEYEEDDIIKITQRATIHDWWRLTESNDRKVILEIEKKVSEEIISLLDELTNTAAS